MNLYRIDGRARIRTASFCAGSRPAWSTGTRITCPRTSAHWFSGGRHWRNRGQWGTGTSVHALRLGHSSQSPPRYTIIHLENTIMNRWLARFNRREIFRGAGRAPSPAWQPGCPPRGSSRAGANLYESIGVVPMINCRGTFTIISGSQTLAEVKRPWTKARGIMCIWTN